MNPKYAQSLLRQPRKLFHTQDLAVLWHVGKANTLHTTIKRYCQSGTLQRIHKGLYATVDPKMLDPLALGMAILHKYAYLSCESILQTEGLLNPVIPYQTLVSSQARSFSANGNHYRCRKLPDIFLFNDYGIEKQNGIAVASVARAVADQLYFNPQQHFDGRIPIKAVRQVQERLGYPLTRTSMRKGSA